MLEVAGLCCGYGDIAVTHDVALTVPDRTVVALLGANGAGKSTTLLAIAGLLRQRTGRITYDGARIDRLSTPEILRRGLAIVAERRELFLDMTVTENLRLGAFLRKARAGDPVFDEVVALFPRLRERLKQRAGTLSGGEQQMLAIARGLMAKPRTMMLDEPSLGIAPKLVEEIFQAIAAMVAKGMSVLLVEQNAVRALEIASYAYLMENGRVIHQDVSAVFQGDRRIRERYLG